MPPGRLDEFHIPPSLFYRFGSIQHGASDLCLITLTLAHSIRETHTRRCANLTAVIFLKDLVALRAFSYAGALLLLVGLLLRATHLIFDFF